MSLTLANDGRPTADAARRILIVEDNAAMARCLAGIAKNFGSVSVEATVCGALEQLTGHWPWTAFIVDLGLPDGSGVEVVSAIRARDGNVPALVLTGNHEHDAINAAFDLRSQYLAKPARRVQIEQFLNPTTARPLSDAPSPTVSTTPLRDPIIRIEERLARLAESCKLTPIEVDLVEARLRGFSGKEYVENHLVSVNTYKTRVRRALRKLGAHSLSEVSDRLLRSR
jgi:two-component system response regulator DevR